MAKPQPKYEFDVRGRDENSAGNDPKHFVLLGDDYAGRPAIVCDTLNCDSSFDLDEQRAHMERITLALNDHMTEWFFVGYMMSWAGAQFSSVWLKLKSQQQATEAAKP